MFRRSEENYRKILASCSWLIVSTSAGLFVVDNKENLTIIRLYDPRMKLHSNFDPLDLNVQ